MSRIVVVERGGGGGGGRGGREVGGGVGRVQLREGLCYVTYTVIVCEHHVWDHVVQQITSTIDLFNARAPCSTFLLRFSHSSIDLKKKKSPFLCFLLSSLQSVPPFLNTFHL